jgi:ABC-type transport system involved in multi-copper enzyme maturation permease subunit
VRILSTRWAALAGKAWLETRARFLTGALVTVAVTAFMTLMRPRIVAQWQRDLLEHPEWRNPVWFDDVLRDYSFYLWHYLYQDMLQKTVIVFAVLLGVGGLTREAAYGTVGFTLALPVRRRTLVMTRAAVAALEVLALGALALLTTMVCTLIIGETYTAEHGALHSTLIVAGGCAALAASLALSTAVEGEHAPALIGLATVTLFYFVAQPYTDGETEPPLVRALNFQAVLAGGQGASLTEVRWLGVAVVMMLGLGALLFTIWRSQARDY